MVTWPRAPQCGAFSFSGRRLRATPFLLFASQFMKRAEVFFWQPHIVVATERPPNVASQTTFQAPAIVVYFHKRSLALKAITDGAFVGHCEPGFGESPVT